MLDCRAFIVVDDPERTMELVIHRVGLALLARPTRAVSCQPPQRGRYADLALRARDQDCTKLRATSTALAASGA